MEYVTKIVHEYNDIVGKLTPAEVRSRKKKRPMDVGQHEIYIISHCVYDGILLLCEKRRRKSSTLPFTHSVLVAFLKFADIQTATLSTDDKRVIFSSLLDEKKSCYKIQSQVIVCH